MPVATHEFMSAARAQAAALGRADFDAVYVRHPVQDQTQAELEAKADAVIERQGLFSSLYTDRGSHYWLTPKAGERVDREQPKSLLVGRRTRAGMRSMASVMSVAMNTRARTAKRPQNRVPAIRQRSTSTMLVCKFTERPWGRRP